MTTDINQEVDLLKEMNRGTKLTREGQKYPQFLYALTVSIGALLCGCAMFWGPSIDDLPEGPVNFEQFTINAYLNILTTLPDTKKLIADLDKWLTLWFSFGGMFGAMATCIIADRFGRQKTLMISTIPWVFTWLTMVITENRYVLYGARFVCGVITGIYSATIPMYLTEIAEDSFRGTIGGMFPFFVLVGSVIAEALSNFITLGYGCGVITAACLVLFFLIPESPVYLLKTDVKAAGEALKRLRGADYNVDVELFNLRGPDKVIRRTSFLAVILCVELMVCRKFCGIDYVIFTVAEGVFPKMQWISSGFALWSSTIGVVLMLATFIGSLLADKVRRRKLLIISGVGMAACLTCLAILLDGEAERENWNASLVIVAFLSVYSIGFGLLPWVLPAELFLPWNRPLIFGVVASTNWLGDLLLLSFSAFGLYEWIVRRFSISVLLMTFAVISADSAALVYFFLPETMMHEPTEQKQQRLLKV